MNAVGDIVGDKEAIKDVYLWVFVIVNLIVPLSILLPFYFLFPVYVSPVICLLAASIGIYFLAEHKGTNRGLLSGLTVVVSLWVLWSMLDFGKWFDNFLFSSLLSIMHCIIAIAFLLDHSLTSLCYLQFFSFIVVPVCPLGEMSQPEAYARISLLSLSWIVEVVVGSLILKDEVNLTYLLMQTVPLLRLQKYIMVLYACLIIGFRGLHFKNFYKKTRESPEEVHDIENALIKDHSKQKPPAAVVSDVTPSSVPPHDTIPRPQMEPSPLPPTLVKTSNEKMKKTEKKKPLPEKSSVMSEPVVRPAMKKKRFAAIQASVESIQNQIFPSKAPSPPSYTQSEQSSVISRESRAPPQIKDISGMFDNFNEFLTKKS